MEWRATEDLFSLVLFSAMRFGGCNNASRLHALMMALRYPPKRYQHHYWFELEHDSGGRYVWRPDPLTLALLVRWYTQEHHRHWAIGLPVAPNPHRLMATFFRKQGIWARHGMPIKRLLDAVSARLSLEVPPILADCTRGVIDNRTLSPAAFHRYITGKSPRFASSKSNSGVATRERVAVPFSPPPNANDDADPQMDNRFWANARRILRLEKTRRDARLAIQKHLDQSQSDLLLISRLLASWIIHLLSTHNQWGNRLKPSAIGVQLSAVLVGLKDRIGNSECLGFWGSEWGDVYLQILDTKSSLSSRRMAQKTLGEFHQFLVTEYGANETDGVTLANKGTKALPHVDANVLFEGEFLAACRYFEEQRQRALDGPSWGLATCQLIALILGFRCGLRRSEVYWLRICDIELGSEAEILLAGKRPVTLKSNSAHRRIPIYLLMKPWELEVVKGWIRGKLELGEDENAPLFSTHDEYRLLIPSKELFDPLQSVLQVITGDPDTRFHHLRHSCATHLFYYWVRPDLAPSNDYKWVSLQRRRILQVTHGSASSRAVAKALHVMVGHAGVEMSMTHYVHSVEWLVFDRLSSMSPRLPTKTLSRLTGLTERQIQRLSKDQSMNAVAIRDHSHRNLRAIVPEMDTSAWCAPSEKRIQIRTRKNSSRERMGGGPMAGAAGSSNPRCLG